MRDPTAQRPQRRRVACRVLAAGVVQNGIPTLSDNYLYTTLYMYDDRFRPIAPRLVTRPLAVLRPGHTMTMMRPPLANSPGPGRSEARPATLTASLAPARQEGYPI